VKLKRKENKLVGNWAVLLIDMQPRFLQRLDEIKRENLIAHQMSVIRCCADYDIPVILVEYNITDTEYDIEDNEEPTVEILLKAAEAVPRREKITKKTADAFTYPYLLSHLRYWGVDGVVLMGVYASYCVRITAESALRKGFKIATAKELIADQDGKVDLCWYRRNGLCFRNSQKLVEALIYKEYI
jgi:nicotinamidase-related amidase